MKKYDDKNKDVVSNENIPIDQNTSFNIMKKALVDIGCKPKINDDDSIIVAYQGKDFYIRCDGLYTTIWDPLWSYIEADDPDLPIVREVINATNIAFDRTIVWRESDEDGNIYLYTKKNIMLHPSFPDVYEYIQAELDAFFEIEEWLREKFKPIDLKQKERLKRKEKKNNYEQSYKTRI